MKLVEFKDDLVLYHWLEAPETAFFQERLNRFACMVELAGKSTKVYLPNSGRLEELLHPGARVILEHRRQEGKTHHDLLMVETPAYPDSQPIWAALDSRLPPKLLRFVLEQNLLDEFAGWALGAMEPAVADGRLDLLLTRGDQQHFIETKSVNLLDSQGTARFPDAPTERGSRHVRQLAELKRAGNQASLFFIIVRPDALTMAPFTERDPDFSLALQQAASAGVNIRALAFEIGPSIQLRRTIPIDLTPKEFPGYWPISPSAYTN